MNKGLLPLIMVALQGMIFTGAGEPSIYPMTVTDSAGMEVVLEMPVQRIIVLNSDAAEAVAMLGATDRVVGVVDTVSKKDYYFPELKDKEVVGTWKDFDYEKIAEIARNGSDEIVPDILVLCYSTGSYKGTSYAVDAVEEGLAPFGNIAVAGFYFYKDENLSREMTTLGQMLGRDEEAADYLAWRSERAAGVEAAVGGLEPPRVYFEYAASGPGEVKTNGMASEINSMIEAAGGVNVAGERPEESVTTDWEWVIEMQPGVIIRTKSDDLLGWGAYPSADTIRASKVRDEITGREGSEGLPAVKDDRVYVIYRDILYGMDSVVGLTYLADLLHPDAGLDPVQVHMEYLERIGIDYPTDSTYVYPEAEG